MRFLKTADISADPMEQEIRKISKFHTLKLIRIVQTVSLIGFETMRAVWGFRMTSATYVLMVVWLLPPLLEGLFVKWVKEDSDEPVLPYLRKQYHYSILRMATGQVSLYFTLFLLCLWQLHNKAEYPFAWLADVPAGIAVVSAVMMLVGPALVGRRIHRKMMRVL